MKRTSIAVILLFLPLLGCQSNPSGLATVSRRPWAPPALPSSALPPSHGLGQRQVAPASFAITNHRQSAQSVDSTNASNPSLSPSRVAPMLLPAKQASDVVANHLSLPELEAIALQNSPAMAEALARADAAEGAWEQAGMPPNPILGYSGQQLGSGGLAEQQGIYLGQQFLRGGKLQLSQQVAVWRVEVAKQHMAATRLRLLTDVRCAYYRLLAAQHRQIYAAELVASAEHAVAAAESLFSGEEVSEADPLRAKIAADGARLVQQAAANRLLQAKRKLQALLGSPHLVLGEVAGPLDEMTEPLTWGQVLPHLMSASPQMAAAAANIEAAQWAVERAHAEAVSDIDVQAVIQDDRGTGGTNSNLQVSMPIPIRNRNQGGIRKARAEAVAAQMAADRIALRLQTDLAEVFQRYQTARDRVQQFVGEKGMIAKAEKAILLIRAGYDIEEFSVTDLLSAQRQLFEMRLDYLDALADMQVAAAEIRGMLLKDSLSN